MAEVLVIQRIFTAYRKSVLDELHKHLDFVLLHSRNKSGIRQVTASYDKEIGGLQYSRNPTNVFLNVFGYVLKNKPKIIIHEFTIGIISLFPTLLLSKILGIKFILWGHGYNRRIGFSPKSSLLDKVRLFIMRRADAIILYGQESKSMLAKNLSEDKFFVAYNCLNTNLLSEIRNNFEIEGRKKIKEQIGFTYKYNLIFIGRILKYKQPDLLIDVYEKYLQKKYGNSLCIHFVGKGDFLMELHDKVTKLGIENNVKFHGEIYEDVRVGALLFSSDLMVMPGLLGLSVNHAFNFDCPVVTFSHQGHGPEIEYLINEKTGFIIENQSIQEMASVIDAYLGDKNLQHKMKKNIRDMVDQVCSLDNFIKGFIDVKDYVLKK